MQNIQWKTIIKYAVIMFLATAAAAFPFGFVQGWHQAQNSIPPQRLIMLAGFVVPLAALIVYIFFIKSVQTSPWLHVFLLTFIVWLVSFPLNVLLLQQPMNQWLVSGPFFFVIGLVGTFISLFLFAEKS